MPARDYDSIPIRCCSSRQERMCALVDVLWDRFAAHGYSWVGFYTKAPGEELLLGPRRDKPACSPIGLHGICGLAWRERRAVLVTDVRTLGSCYVACDPHDMAEVVVPLLEPDGSCWGVLDVDSFEIGSFTAADALGLARLVERSRLSEPLADRAWPILAGEQNCESRVENPKQETR